MRGVPAKRTYDDPCGVARALNVVGERWALLVVRELLFGPKRFTDLSHGLPGMSQNVLSDRLRELEQAGIVRRRRLGPPASARIYELTERGAELEPVLDALARWGSRNPLDSIAELSVDAFILALKTTFDPRAAAGLQARCDLRLGDDCFQAKVADGRFEVARGGAQQAVLRAAEQADATLETDVATLRALVFGGRPVGDALASGELHLEGDPELAARFVTCFPRPTLSGRSLDGVG
jgi:DNA-binding HxlR family transcriptional regulator